ncbi:hypothetical protein [Neobacillus cucumis]|uniref:hypothetical protein n=1 Tax=Neobacillus cucumis TaxID=1740721 RepID=UPI00196684E2|nr:hypothetical protein [Neobacillus cucumis]MBM7650868.1 hypothetical protein [Neobacillus cucumis]
MLSFEEKKAIFHSFKLKEKTIGNGKVSFVYPESVQKGQVLATQLHPSGNGYVIGKYMSEETIKKHGYQVDPRGWISIKVFSKEEIAKVITEAMKSMSGIHVGNVFKEVVNEDRPDESVEVSEAVAIVNKAIKVTEKEVNQSLDTLEKLDLEKMAAGEADGKQSTYDFYPGSYLFDWMGLALSTMEYGYWVWRKAFRSYISMSSSDSKTNQ